MYQYGRGCDVDISKARSYLEDALGERMDSLGYRGSLSFLSTDNISIAQYHLGLLYEGMLYGTDKDEQNNPDILLDARPLLTAALNKGIPNGLWTINAQHHLAMMYYTGTGGNKDLDQCRMLWERIVDADICSTSLDPQVKALHASAQWFLAICYMDLDTDANWSKIVTLFKNSIESGYLNQKQIDLVKTMMDVK